MHSKIIKLVKKYSYNRGNKIKETSLLTTIKYCNLDYLIERTKSNPKLLTEMIALYLEQTPVLVKAMKKGLEQKDWVSVNAVAHKMIPSFSIMGMHKDYENIAKKVQEYSGANKQIDKLPDLILQLEKVCLQACEELKNDLKKMKNEK